MNPPPPPDGNPTAVNKYQLISCIISYHIIYHTVVSHVNVLARHSPSQTGDVGSPIERRTTDLFC